MRVILIANGVQTKQGADLIKKGIRKLGIEDLSEKRILVVQQERIRNQVWMMESISDAFVDMGFTQENITVWSGTGTGQTENNDELYDVIYIGEGEAVALAQEFQASKGVCKIIRDCVKNNAVYIGASCGAVLAGKDVYLAKYYREKMPVSRDGKEQIPEGLGLLEGAAVVPHYGEEDFKRFIHDLSKEERSRYKRFYSVPDGEMLVLEKQQGG